jgi:hypothetical protein
MLEKYLESLIGPDWKTTAQPVLSTVLTLSAVCAVAPPPHLSPWAAWALTALSAYSKIRLGQSQKDAK